MKQTVGICIATHNRYEDLARTLRELARLDPQPAEIIVLADGCTDGTTEFVTQSFPAIRLLEHPKARGSIPSRNEMAAACRSEIFLSLDDDSYPVESDFITRVAQSFEENPALAVLSFPQRTDEFPETLTKTDFGPAQFVGSYANSGAAIRRSVFTNLGAYPEFFRHAYEEPDFALRCVAAGWQVRQETSLTIRHHYTSAERSELRVHQRHARNEQWSVLMRCPLPYFPAVALFRLLRQAGYARRRGLSWLLREPLWWCDCLRGTVAPFARRQPLPWPKYRAWMELVHRPIRSEEEWLAKFGSPVP
jgi:GT2 family glycosyltransferase